MISGNRRAFHDLRFCLNQTEEGVDAVFLMALQRDVDIGNGVQSDRLGADLRSVARYNARGLKIPHPTPALRGGQARAVCKLLH